jgi:hypothetical protein
MSSKYSTCQQNLLNFIGQAKQETRFQNMTYEFFANKDDKLQVLQYIFMDTDLQIYDAYSSYGQEIVNYRNMEEIISKFDLIYGGQNAVTFQLWTPRFKGQPIFRKIDIDPKRCNGHNFRFSTNGWGLIQLYFGGLIDNQLHRSHIGHFNEAGALKKESIGKFNGSVGSWDWKEIQSTSQQLKYKIHNKLATRKIGSQGILTGADKLTKEGILLC